MKYRKKPVEIEARQTGQDYDTDCEILAWCGGELRLEDESDALFHIVTLEGAMAVTPGDWVCLGARGEFYLCKPDVFLDVYEQIDGPCCDAVDIEPCGWCDELDPHTCHVDGEEYGPGCRSCETPLMTP